MTFMYDLIEELCVKRGIKVTALCRDCGIPRSILTDYKKGRIKCLSVDTLCRIADYFGVSVDYLCGAPFTAANEEQLKTLLFGEGVTVTDEMWEDVKKYAEFVKTKYCV